MKIVCSFCHAYLDNKLRNQKKYPALITLEKSNLKKYSYVFPRNLHDFKENKHLIKGDSVPKKHQDFKKLPRFGFTGLTQSTNYIFAGSWNGVYMISKKNLELKTILSNRLTADLHGIYYYKKKIYSTLAFKDTLVITDLNGKIENFYTITEELKVKKNDYNILKTDWRFVTKQRRGPTGIFHFNHIRVENNNVFLTSRNLGTIIKFNLISKKINLISLGHMKTSLIHDGKKKFDKLFFTSVDGKIIIVDTKKKISRQEKVIKKKIKYKNFNNSYALDYFIIDKTNLKRIPKWCRGLEVLNRDKIVTTVDGLYGESFFSIVIFDIKKNIKISEYKFRTKKLNNYKSLRYASGFDLITF